MIHRKGLGKQVEHLHLSGLILPWYNGPVFQGGVSKGGVSKGGLATKGGYYALRRTETAWKLKYEDQKTVSCPIGAGHSLFLSRNRKEKNHE